MIPFGWFQSDLIRPPGTFSHRKRQDCRKTMSLRGSAHTAVAIPRIFKHFRSQTSGFYFYLGDSHTSLRTGSE